MIKNTNCQLASHATCNDKCSHAHSIGGVSVRRSIGLSDTVPFRSHAMTSAAYSAAPYTKHAVPFVQAVINSSAT